MNIDQVAALARIKLREGEKESLSRDLAGILEYVDQLKKLDTKGVLPTSHVLEIENVFRADERKPQDVREEALRHAPAREGPFFRVPKVIEGE